MRFPLACRPSPPGAVPRPVLPSVVLALASLLVAACGGGGGSGGSQSPAAPLGGGGLSTFTGRVVDGAGAPVAGAIVAANSPSTPQATTAASGTFSLPVEAGDHDLVIVVHGVLCARRGITSTGSGTVPLGDLQALASVTGRLVGAHGEPVAGAIFVAQAGTEWQAVSDANGDLALQMPPGTHDFEVRKDGAAIFAGEAVISIPGPIALGSIQVLSEVGARLLDGLMQPLAGAVVTIDTEPVTWTVTDAAGLFAAPLPAGAYTLAVTWEGVRIWESPLTVETGPPVSLGRLQVLVRTVGRVIDPELEPVAGAEVVVDTVPPLRADTDADGDFALDLPVGDWQLSVRLAGVTSGQGTITTAPGGGIAWVGELVVDGFADSDADGLSDWLETTGWSIPVNENGGDDVTWRVVTSDPNRADSDGDVVGAAGFDDAQEFALRTDPRRVDTDGDLLSDWEEVTVYKSDPAHVDTDGDARERDADGVPFGPANPSLFDGFELLLSGTSPTLADTDGDGLDDRREILNGGFRPLVADQPLVDIEVIGDPLVALNATVSAQSVSSVLQRDQASQVRSDSSTTQTTTEKKKSVSATGKVSYPWGGSLEVKASASWKQSTMNETSSNFTTASQSETQETFEASTAESYEDGTIRVAMRVANRSDLSFLIQDLSILVYRVRPTQGSGALQVIGTLFEEGGALGSLGTAPGTLVGPQGDFSFVASNEDLNYQPIVDYMQKPGGLFFEVGSYSLLQVDGQGNVIGNYDAIAQDVVERTALIVIDYGGGEIERHAVATNVRRNPDGSAAGITMQEALAILEVPYTTTPGTGCPTPELPGTRGVELLTGVRDKHASPEVQNPGGNVPVCTLSPIARQWWMVLGAEVVAPDPVVDSACGSEPGEVLLDFDDIRLFPGQRVTLVYVTDVDNDGLTDREEVLYGTSDLSCDTDGDGLSDNEEVAIGWRVEFRECPGGQSTTTQFDYDVFSNPRFDDIDGDGLSDADERALGTDPNEADTDGDGEPDGEDPCPTEPFFEGGGGVPSEGLVSYLRLNADAVQNGGVEPDLSGAGHDFQIDELWVNQMFSPGASADGVWTWIDRHGRFDKAFWFANSGNGGSSAQHGYLERDTSGGPVFDRSFTWAGWIRLSDTSLFKEASTIFSIEDWAALRIRNSGGFDQRLAFEIGQPGNPTGTVAYRLADPSEMDVNTWVFVCVTVEYFADTNQTQIRLYRDGQAVATDTRTGPLTNPSLGDRFHVAVTWTPFGPPGGDVYVPFSFRGAMDDLRFFDRGLTPGEVNGLYMEVVPPGQ